MLCRAINGLHALAVATTTVSVRLDSWGPPILFGIFSIAPLVY